MGAWHLLHQALTHAVNYIASGAQRAHLPLSVVDDGGQVLVLAGRA